jgi:hypothetical protein
VLNVDWKLLQKNVRNLHESWVGGNLGLILIIVSVRLI